MIFPGITCIVVRSFGSSFGGVSYELGLTFRPETPVAHPKKYFENSTSSPWLRNVAAISAALPKLVL